MSDNKAHLNDLIKDPGPMRFWKGITGKLMLWFLALSLIPLTLISIISYRSARNSLYEAIADSLSAMTENQAAHIETYFKRMSTELQQQAASRENAEFLLLLSMNLEESNASAREYVESTNWDLLVLEREPDLVNLQSIFGYRDVFLIDEQGNILFSTARNRNLGANLFTDATLSDSLFSKACRQALDSGTAIFSDFERQADESISGYLTAPIMDDDGAQIGLFAMQVGMEGIQPIMASSSTLGKTSESYLIGSDLTLRSSSRQTDHEILFGERVDTEQVRLWRNNKGRRLSSYTGAHGVAVLGSRHTVTIAGKRFCLISELEQSEAYAPARSLAITSFALAGFTAILVIVLSAFEARQISRPLRLLAKWARRVGEGDLRDTEIVTPPNETGILYETFRSTVTSLRKAALEHKALDWVNLGLANLNDAMRGQKNIPELCRDIINSSCRHLNVPIGTLFLASEDQSELNFTAGFAYEPSDKNPSRHLWGEGLVGQAAQDHSKIIVHHLPKDHLTLSTTMGEAVPCHVACIPLIYNKKVAGVIEVGSFAPLSTAQIAFLDQVSEIIAIAINSAQMQERTKLLLEESQTQAEELQAQEEKLRVANEELEEKSEELQAQQEELRQTNEELQEKTDSLQQHSDEIREKNQQLERAGKALQQKAKDLAQTSKYKSEFLANMSHELRTPLNSLLVLAHHLAENQSDNLTEQQIESARVIAASGENLLLLINDILDLSKIEAGKMILHPRTVKISDIETQIQSDFAHMAEEKGLEFFIQREPDVPKTIYTDPERLQQIIRNLVANAIKFTHQGHVTVHLSRPQPNAPLPPSLPPKSTIELTVSDSGIGIPKAKLKAIFEAFQQADGSTTRQYGGTGLGLSITRELALLLHGNVTVKSEEGKGSTFTVRIPEELDHTAETKFSYPPTELPESPAPMRDLSIASMNDDRKNITPDDKVVLLIEDDPHFAKTLELMAHAKQFKCLHAPDGPTGLKLAEQFLPNAIILDIRMPGMDGWQVLEELKNRIHTRHIPVHIMSAADEHQQDAVQRGAIGYLTKPVNQNELDQAFNQLGLMAEKDIKELLIIEDNENMQLAISRLLKSAKVKTTSARSIQESMEILNHQAIDCIILDLNLPDGSGVDLIKQIKADQTRPLPPVIIYTGRELTREEHEQLQEYTQSIIVKGPMAEERLVDETALFLHQLVEKLPERKKEMILRLHKNDAVFEGKTVLLVDDDMRNVFALASILESKGLIILKASDGNKALKRLRENPETALVLMDIMMPNMNGYEAMRQIRDPETDLPNHDIPIIALTAKAMKEDRAKCIEAGANDYLSKPVKMEKLLSLMRVWLAP